MGIATLTRLKQMEYVNMYYETKAARLSHEESETPGFRMTTGSKPRVIGQLKNAIEEDDIWVPSKAMIAELKTYVTNENGKTEALPGHHDDTVMALGIAWEVRRTHIDRLVNTKVSWKNKYTPIPEEHWI